MHDSVSIASQLCSRNRGSTQFSKFLRWSYKKKKIKWPLSRLPNIHQVAKAMLILGISLQLSFIAQKCISFSSAQVETKPRILHPLQTHLTIMSPTPVPTIFALCHLRFSLCSQPQSLASLCCRLAQTFSPYQFSHVFSAFLFLLQTCVERPLFLSCRHIRGNHQESRAGV